MDRISHFKMITTNSILFYALVFLGVAGVFSLMFFFRTRLLERQKQKLQTRVKEQTAELETSLKLLQQKTDELEETNYIKNKLISVLSHDLNTPLQFISLVSDHLQEFPDDTVEIQSGLRQIKESSDQLISMTDDLLNWMKAQDTGFTISNDSIALKEMISGKLAFFTPLAESDAIYLNNEVHELANCFSDQCLLGIIMHNLISNAVKFTPRGHVTITSADLPEYTVITVTDTGIGMNETKLAQVQQATLIKGDNSYSGITGKGMGLMLIHNLARILNVRIHYNSKEQMGTSVAVHVPKKRA